MVAKVINFQKEINNELRYVQQCITSIREKIGENCGKGGFLKGVVSEYLHSFDSQMQMMNSRLDYDISLWQMDAVEKQRGAAKPSAKPDEKNSGFFRKIKSGVAKLLSKEANAAPKK